MIAEATIQEIVTQSRWATTVGKVCDQYNGEVQTGPFGSQLHASDYTEDGAPVVMPQDMVDGKIVCDRIARVGPQHVRQLKRHMLCVGDIVYSRRGDVTRFAVVTKNEEGWLCGTGSIRIRLNCPEIEIAYVRHYLRQEPVGKWLMHHAKGVTMPNLNTSIIRALPFVYPPLAEQKRIAAILDAADALRTKRREALAQLDALLQSSFLTLFGDPVSHTQKLPIQPLESLLARPLQNGAYYPKETYTEVGGVEMVHMSDAFYEIVPRGKLKRVICPKADTEKYALTENDILIARRSLTLEGAAKPCLIPKSNEPLMFESSFIRVTPRPETITPLYLYHYLANDRVKQKSVRPYITQSTISGINQSNLEKVPVIVPPIALQRRFTGIVESVERQKAAQRAHLAELDALFAALQHRAFRGEL